MNAIIRNEHGGAISLHITENNPPDIDKYRASSAAWQIAGFARELADDARALALEVERGGHPADFARRNRTICKLVAAIEKAAWQFEAALK